jgi:hypothetical protein
MGRAASRRSGVVSMKLLLAASALAALFVAADPPYKPDPAFAARDGGPGTIDVSSYPAEQQQNYETFSAKCSKCHPLARPINSRFTAAEWKRYMKRMVRRPNSGINEEQAKHIYDFLKHYSAQLGL